MRMISVVLLIMVFASPLTRGEVTIEIVEGNDKALSIAVVPFSWQGSGVLPENIAAIIGRDMERSGQFVALRQQDMYSLPSREAEIAYRDWRTLKVENLLIGRISERNGRLQIDYELYDTQSQTQLARKTIVGAENQLRDMAHYIADQVYEKLTGLPGAFSTRIAYVLETRSGDQQLVVADADGERERVLLTSKEPILSASWSPDGRQLAYVSFEGGRSGIYVHDVQTNRRQKIPSFQGLNGAPAFSPDGSALALVLSRDGNAEIYVMDLASKRFTRVTRHIGIDTEPNWFPDGKSLLFTSNRGGRPQIYRVYLDSGEIERMTYEGPYNARGRVLPDGSGLIFVHQRGDVFNIAVQDFRTGTIIPLTETSLDESPSVAPNGTMLLYATKDRGKGILSAVSIDGITKIRLPSPNGDIREPAWSPFGNFAFKPEEF